MAPVRGRSGTRKGSSVGGSGKKAAPKVQPDVQAHPSALNSETPDAGPTYQCGAYLRDLNDGEKKKVANLIQQIVHMGSKVQTLEDANAKLRREAAGELQSPQNKALVHTNAELRTKLTSGVTMLRKCQDLLQLAHMQAGAQDAAQTGNIPDIDAFAASCVPLGVADQRAFARTYSPQATASEQAGENGPWHSGEYAQPGTPHSPRKDTAFSFSFPQPPNGEVPFSQGPRSPSRASSTPQPRPKRSRKSQSPLPRSPGKLPDPLDATSPQQPHPQPYLSPPHSPQHPLANANANTTANQPSDAPAAAPYLAQTSSRPPVHFLDAQHRVTHPQGATSPEKPHSAGREAPKHRNTSTSPSRHPSPGATSAQGCRSRSRASRSPSKPAGTFGTSPRFDYLSPPAQSSTTKHTVPVYLRSYQDASSPLGKQGASMQSFVPTGASATTAAPPATSTQPQYPGNANSSFFEATLNPGAFQAAFAATAALATAHAPSAAAFPNAAPAQVQHNTAADSTSAPAPPQVHHAHACNVAPDTTPSNVWPQASHGAMPPPAASQQPLQDACPASAPVHHRGPFPHAAGSHVSPANAHAGPMHDTATVFPTGPAGWPQGTTGPCAFPESSAGDPSTTTPQTNACHHSSNVSAPAPHGHFASGSQSHISMHGVTPPEATCASTGSVDQVPTGTTGNAWEGIGAPWSTFAQNFTGPSDSPPWGGQQNGAGGRLSPSDLGSGSSGAPQQRDVSFQESEDVHVHIHFDGPAMQPQAHQPYAPPPFSPDCTRTHFKHAPLAATYHPEEHFSQFGGEASACYGTMGHLGRPHVGGQPFPRGVPLVPPPALPLQPLTRLIDFDDSLADLVSQVEASMHVSGEPPAREHSAREASEHACNMLTELAPPYHQKGGYRCDSATSIPGDGPEGVGLYMHAEQGCSSKQHLSQPTWGQRDEGYRQAQDGAGRDDTGTVVLPARSRYGSTRSGDVRTTSRSGEVFPHAMHRTDTALHHGKDPHWGGGSMGGQENSLCHPRHDGGSLSPNVCSRGVEPAYPSSTEHARGRVRQGDAASVEWSAGGAAARKYGNRGCAYGSVHPSEGRKFVGPGKAASQAVYSRPVGSPSCLDEQDREMLDVLNCLM